MHRIRTEYPYAGDLTMLGAHSSHSYQTGTNLYFVYDYNIDCEPTEEITKYHIPINAIIVEEALKHQGLHGPPPRDREVPDRLDRARARQRLLHVAQAEGSL